MEQLQYLVSRGYVCTALHFRKWDGGYFNKTRRFTYKGIKIIQSAEDDDKYIRSVIAEENPSIIYTYSFPAPKTLVIARKMGIKTILGAFSIREINDIFSGRHTSYDGKTSVYKNPGAVFRLADAVITPSRFLEKTVRRYTGRIKKDPPLVRVIHPASRLEKVRAKKHLRRYITMICPVAGKGAFVAAALAAHMPQYPFLIAGEGSKMVKLNIQTVKLLKQLGNVFFMPHQTDVRRIYEKTKILLVPSLVQESFSRVAWEAMANGIPVIGSDKGNLPFLIKDGGYTCRPRDIRSWRICLKRLMTDKIDYKQRSRRAYMLSKRYVHEEAMEKFYDTVYRLLE